MTFPPPPMERHPSAISITTPPKRTLWDLLGFGTCSASRPEGDDDTWAPGWFTVQTFSHLGFAARLRVLVSGNLMTESAIKTDVVINKARTASAMSVLPPGNPR